MAKCRYGYHDHDPGEPCNDKCGKTMNLRELARGQQCQVRLEGICNFNPETTVLAHYRLTGISGIGMKAPDEIAAFACSNCHDAIDRRRFLDLDRDYVRLAHAEGVFRTWMIINREGET